MDENEVPLDFSEFLKSLNDHDVDYLIIGGYAVAVHGYPRFTDDLDVIVSRDSENAERVVAALRHFGFDLPEVEPELFTTPDRVVRMGVSPVRIEVLTSADGIEFENIVANRVLVDIGGVTAPVIGLLDLRANKLASGRLKDLADLEELPLE